MALHGRWTVLTRSRHCAIFLPTGDVERTSLHGGAHMITLQQGDVRFIYRVVGVGLHEGRVLAHRDEVVPLVSAHGAAVAAGASGTCGAS